SVYNGADRLPETMESILSQEGVSLEFVIVNDGSKDGAGAILDGYADRDPRVRVLHQKNQGLTCALIRGCAAARGEYIVRQDAGGDISLPGRLERQLTHLSQCSDAVMSSCGTRYVGPAGETLYEITQSESQLDWNLRRVSSNSIL